MKFVKFVYLEIIVCSIIAMPFAINYATRIRGYKAYGGEYLIPILGWIIATFFYEICKDIIESKSENKK